MKHSPGNKKIIGRVEAGPMSAKFNFRKFAVRAWLWIGIFTAILWIYPVAYQTTRLFQILGVAVFWLGAIFLWWRKRIVRLPVISLAIILVTLMSLPGRAVRTESLAKDYCGGLRLFRGVRYIWGGENLVGIDCSGLVREGLIWGELGNGLRTLNGWPIRDALWLWWHDCSALALRDGFKGLTRECFRAPDILAAERGALQPGDFAVTADGVHVLAYLENHTWIEADPNLHKVVEITVPNDNPWFHTPVVIVRWRVLDKT